MYFLEEVERELMAIHDRHQRELWEATRRLLARSHTNGRRLGQRPDATKPDRERDLPGWIAAREAVRPQKTPVAPRPVDRAVTPVPRPSRFRLPWAKQDAKRAASR